jgi:hypothetical protein
MIDLMIVMTLTIMLLSMCSIWVHKTMQYASNISQRESHSQNISRIGRRLRIDTMQADSIDLSGETIRINCPSHVAEFTIESNTIIRKSTKKETTQLDRFTFANNATLEWNRSDWPSWILLEIGRDYSELSVDKNAPGSKLDAQIRIGVSKKDQP